MTTIAIVGKSGTSFCQKGWGVSDYHSHCWAKVVPPFAMRAGVSMGMFQPLDIKYDIMWWPKILSMIVGNMI